MGRQVIFLSFILFLLLGAILLKGCKTGKEKKAAETTPVNNTSAIYTGSNACQSCHQKEFNDWKLSDHYLAMQHAHDSTVLGDFNNTTFKADGITSTFFKRDGKYFINTQGDDGNNHDYEVLYVFGYFPLQQYLIAFPGGRLQATRVSWDSRENKWFNQYAGQTIHHKDWLHWTGNGQNWNTMCASCHSTDLQKNYQFSSDSYATTWKDINVGCETCHGAGSKHIDFMNSPEYKRGVRIENAGLFYGKNFNPQLQLNTCAPCHARKSDIAQKFMQTAEIMDDLIPQIIDSEFYYADGQIKEEDYEYSSFVQSKMFHKEVRCSNCHNPHTGKRLAEGNALCMSCHEPKYNTEAHHFHKINTEGAQCINCHMGVKTYMGNDHRRDHSFRIPRPDQSIVWDTPNTCTSCHEDKSNTWAADAVKKWYGPTRTYHFSDDLLPGSELNDKSEMHLLKLVADTTQPEIARATAVFYLSSIQTPGSVNGILNALSDQKPLVRYHAVRALGNFQPEWWIEKTTAALSDKVRAVRIAAAGLYHRLPAEAIPATARQAYQAANAENQKYLEYQTDFSVGNVMMADYKLQENAQLDAIVYYIRGLQKDSMINYARLNLSAAYSSVGKNSDALKTLNDAVKIDSKNPRIFYNLALLHYEMGDINAAVESFQKAIKVGAAEAGVYYNYGLLLQQQGKLKEAEQILLKGYSLNPQAININYALAYLYANQNNLSKARVHASVLRKLDPSNPDYQGLFRSLGL
jgi:tetratricopeptide (TPR) repeat protein